MRHRSSPLRHRARASARSRRLEKLEPRIVLDGAPVISEFLASNDDTLNDGDGNSSDWIEVHNPTAAPIDLAGWRLTDNANELDKWTFPNAPQSVLAPGAYLVVFASGQPTDDYVDPAGNLHTNFLLSAGGEYLGLVDPDDTVVQEFAPQFLPQTTDISFGVLQTEVETTLIDEGADARYLVPNGAVAGWNTLAFDDSGWQVGPTGIGYENNPANYAALIESTVPLDTDTFYSRQTFEVADPDAIDRLSLRIRYDDGFAAYLNGALVESANAPSTLAFNSIATGNHPDPDAVEFTQFDISDHLDELVVGTNVLAIQALNQATSSDMLLEPKLVASQVSTNDSVGYMVRPTPGAVNVVTGPLITEVTENPAPPAANEDLVIEATVGDNAGNGVARVDLHYRIGFGGEASVQAFDNGLDADAVAGDGVYTAVIGAAAYSAGDMVRWYVTAADSAGVTSRAPVFQDTDGNSQDAEYFGTVVAGPPIATSLPVLRWFTQNESAGNTRSGTRASVFYNDRFYDNIFVRQRGGATNSSVSQKFDFNRGRNLFVSEELGFVGEINLNGNGSDSSYLRQSMGFDAHTAAGGAGSASFPIYMTVNGGFDRIGIWIEQVDDDFLERQGYDPDSDLYKLVQRSNLNPGVSDITTGLEKKTGDTGDLSSFQNLVDGVALASRSQRQAFVRDYVDIAQFLNYMAVRTVQHQADDIRKNMYLYQDVRGDGLWRIFPWDLDWTFNIVGGHDNQDSERTEHPFFGTQAFPTADGFNQWNVLYDAVFQTREVQEMYLRRVRTLMDQFYGGATGGVTWFADYVNTVFPTIDPHLGSSVTNGRNSLLNSIEDRRDELYNDYTANIPGYSVVIPDAQVGNPSIDFGAFEVNPASGNQNQEYIELINNNATAVDLSGWTLSGGVSHVFQPGTVIAAGGSLYVTASVADFRTRTVGPTGGQALFLQEWDSGQLSSFGETVELRAADDSLIDAFTYEGDPSLEQQWLRVSEIHYNPAGPSAAEQSAGYVSAQQFEFIELVNASPTDTLNLNGVGFADGVDLTLGDGATSLLLSADFNAGADGFVYADDTFNGTNNPAFATGERDPAAGPTGDGALRVYLAEQTESGDRGPASGGWSTEFTLDTAATVTVSLDYRMVLGHGYEADEYGEAIVEINGQRLGTGPGGVLLRTDGDGQNPATPPVDSGWRSESFQIALPAGPHQLVLGGFNNKSTFTEEDAEFFFDNVIVTAPSAANALSLAPGERVVVVSDPDAFAFRYGTGPRVVGQYGGSLSNGGERLDLEDATGSTIQEFRYEDGDDPGEEAWTTAPDGGGPSLVAVRVAGEYNDGANWVASSTPGGTPGAGPATPQVAGDFNRDGTVTQDDYAFWLDTWGSSVDLLADGNGDNAVNAADYTIWRDNLGASAPTAIAATAAPPQDGSLRYASLTTDAIDAAFGESDSTPTANAAAPTGSLTDDHLLLYAAGPTAEADEDTIDGKSSNEIVSNDEFDGKSDDQLPP